MTAAAWPFVSYDKIGERLDVDTEAHRALARVPWVVTEKIHGANCCLVTDGNEVRVAKRKGYLEPGEDFFAYERVLPRVEDAIRALHERLAGEPGDFTFAYCELFGGGYPHPGVAPVDGVQPVQTGVYYAPDVELCLFDLARADADGERRYVDYDRALQLCDAVGMPCAQPLFVGKQAEALAYPLGFVTKIPGQLGLPPLPDNLAEGVVVKPQPAIYVAGPKGRFRPAVKRKIDRFAEDERYQGAQKWSPSTTRNPLGRATDAALALVNRARFDNAVSKLGRVRRGDAKRRAALIELLVDDVQAELDAAARGLSAGERTRLAALVRNAIVALVDAQLG